jgi:succinate dehydrogenase/fumarate reductase flavoprotein subunit
MKREVVEADVLCVGGGIAGLMAAIRASEEGARVVVADKANPLRSGSAAVGCDHFKCYLPEYHGPDMKPVLDASLRSITGIMRDRVFIETWVRKSTEIVRLWESWGIPMKYEGRYEFAGHALPGRTLMCLKYEGGEQKAVLTREARKRKVAIMSRVMVFDLIGDGKVEGAVGVNTREDTFYEFYAPCVILGTGLTTRLYPGLTPGWMFNIAYSPNNTGDGRAMAFRAGAEIANAELTMRWSGPKAFARCGKGTWVGVLRDPQGRPVGPFVTGPDRKYGDPTSDLWVNLFEEYAEAGKGPVYFDCGGITDEDYEYMLHWMRHEGNAVLLHSMAEEGKSLRENPVEFATYEFTFSGGVWYNEKGETSLKGLYAAGDEFYGALSCAATFGWIAGESAAKRAAKARPSDGDVLRGQVAEKLARVEEMRSRVSGASWQEVNVALQGIMGDYAGPRRNKTVLEAGLSYLTRLKQKARGMIMVRNQHELMHGLEVINLMDLGELIFVGAMERCESRDSHVRTDYPLTNPLLEKLLLIKQVDGKTVTTWRTLKR